MIETIIMFKNTLNKLINSTIQLFFDNFNHAMRYTICCTTNTFQKLYNFAISLQFSLQFLWSAHIVSLC